MKGITMNTRVKEFIDYCVNDKSIYEIFLIMHDGMNVFNNEEMDKFNLSATEYMLAINVAFIKRSIEI
jgi:hypothetical protein